MAVASLGFSSCVGDLDADNINPQQVPTANYDALLNKVYANMVLTGQKGPDGSGDIDDIDEGTSSLIRQLWNANELPTDETECIWGDAGIPEFNHASWGDSHPMMKALYYRLYMGITYANNYLEATANSTDPEISTKRAEARFLRALHYSYLMDLFGNVPLVLNVSKESAPQVSRKHLFDFINGELREVCGETAGAQEVLSDAKVVMAIKMVMVVRTKQQHGYSWPATISMLRYILVQNITTLPSISHRKLLTLHITCVRHLLAVTQVSRNSLWQIMM